MKKSMFKVVAVAMVLAVSGVAQAIVVDGVISPGEWTGNEVTTGTWNVIAGVYELPGVYAHADEDWLYMGFEVLGADSDWNENTLYTPVMAMNVGADRALTAAPDATLGESGKWSLAMENYTTTADGVFATGHSQYKLNDAGVDGPGSAQTFGVNVTALGSDFMVAHTPGATQVIEYKIAISVLETAFGRTYQDGAITAGDELKIVGFFNRNSQAWSPISYPDGGQWGPSFGDHAGYATVTVTPEPASLGLLAIGAMAMIRRKR